MDVFLDTLRGTPSGAALNNRQLDKTAAFFSLLEEANRSFNLTSIEGPQEAAIRHFADSLAPPALALLKSGAEAIDVGTGAGFPGVPMAIAREDIRVTLLDSNNKKTRFLEMAAMKLGLQNVRVVNARAEDFARGEGREAYDVALSRAVAPLNVLLEYMLPFVRSGGYALAWKGPGAREEVAAAMQACRIMGGSEMRILSYSLEGHDSFCIVAAEKSRPTPPEYPRKAGKPTKSPIM